MDGTSVDEVVCIDVLDVELVVESVDDNAENDVHIKMLFVFPDVLVNGDDR